MPNGRSNHETIRVIPWEICHAQVAATEKVITVIPVAEVISTMVAMEWIKFRKFIYMLDDPTSRYYTILWSVVSPIVSN